LKCAGKRSEVPRRPVGITDDNHILLLVLEDIYLCNPLNKLPVRPLVAESVAPSQKNNGHREGMGKKLLSDCLMPGMIMRSATAHFYTIKVIQDLVKKRQNSAELANV
jgi:hypothetical protein